jgi:hypothetical protein
MEVNEIKPVDKHEINHLESVKATGEVYGLGHDEHGLLKSRFDEMSITKTLWVFRRAVFFTLCVYTGYMCEGFEVSRGSSRNVVGRG